MGNGIKSIGENAFSYCWKLSKVYCYATEPPTYVNSAFEDLQILEILFMYHAKYKSLRSWGEIFKI